jgi:hypothetical protein
MRSPGPGGGGGHILYEPEQIEAYIMCGTHACELSVRINQASGTSLSMTLSLALTIRMWPLLPRTALSSNLLPRPSCALISVAFPAREITLLQFLNPHPRPKSNAPAPVRTTFGACCKNGEGGAEPSVEESCLAKFDETRRAVEDARRREIECAGGDPAAQDRGGRSLREHGNLKVDIDVSLDMFVLIDRIL